MATNPESIQFPTIKELGLDLLELTRLQKMWTILKPFILFGLYFYFSFNEYWVLAVLTIVFLLFVTYVSTSHDLVHNTLRINKGLNNVLLSVIEMLVLRSGHAFKICHLQHHRAFPDHSDIEGASAHMSFIRTLLEGPFYFFRLYRWAFKNPKITDRNWMILEGIVFLLYVAAALLFYHLFPQLLFYFICVQVGSWAYPLFTVYIPHNAKGIHPVYQTRAFRGPVISTLFAHHNYHLEHHLYPMVPHQNWKKLALRLDPYLLRANINIIKL
ncbi:MAG: fatty acid desaturase [Bacteroidota bacterium]